jgi:hypothetical protein
MVRTVGCAIAVLALGAWLGCVKVDDAKKADGSAPHLDAAAGAEAGRDATAAPPTTCREIRVCLYGCGADPACAARCQSSAPARARQQYDEAHACSLRVCPNQEPDCRCIEECLGGGTCSQLVDECDEAVSDPFCDVRCH